MLPSSRVPAALLRTHRAAQLVCLSGSAKRTLHCTPDVPAIVAEQEEAMHAKATKAALEHAKKSAKGRLPAGVDKTLLERERELLQQGRAINRAPTTGTKRGRGPRAVRNAVEKVCHAPFTVCDTPWWVVASGLCACHLMCRFSACTSPQNCVLLQTMPLPSPAHWSGGPHVHEAVLAHIARARPFAVGGHCGTGLAQDQLNTVQRRCLSNRRCCLHFNCVI
jgi:hypothetical protein